MEQAPVTIIDLPPPDVLDLEPAYAVELESSIIIDFEAMIETVENEISGNSIVIDKYELLSVVITSASRRIMQCNEDDIDTYITEWVTDLVKYRNHWDAESQYILNKYKRLVYILMPTVEEYLHVVLDQRNISMNVFFAYPVRLGIFILIPESSHDEVVKNLLSTVFKPH